MRSSSFPDLAVGFLVSGFHLFSMTSRTTPSSPTVSSPSRSEKLLRDALLRDERERQHLSSPPRPKPPTHRRRHTHTPTSSYSSFTKEDYACCSTPHTDVTVSQQARRSSPSGLRKSSADNHSLHSTDSCSTGTSGSSVSHLHIGCASGNCGFHSSLDAVNTPPPQPSPRFSTTSNHLVQQSPPPHPSPRFSTGHHLVQQSPPRFSTGYHLVQQSPLSPRFPTGHHHLVQQSPPNTPSPSTKHFNARKASTECRAIEGYVSFASVEGLGEPPLVGDEFDGDGRGKDEDERMRAVAFLPSGVLSAALRWKKFVGGAGLGIGHGVEGKDRGVVV